MPLKNVFKLKQKLRSGLISEAVTAETQPSKTDITIAQEPPNRRDGDYRINASYLYSKIDQVSAEGTSFP